MINQAINNLIIKVIPLLPIFIVKIFAKRYVAGEEDHEALKVVKLLNHQGYAATLDILGEHTKTASEAKDITDRYIKIYNKIYEKNLDCNISVKPSHIGLDLGANIVKKNIDALIKKASQTNNFLRIDMESSISTDVTIDLFKEYHKNYSNIGIVLQAYLFRTNKDLKNLKSEYPFNFRLCKGIYRESKDIAIQDRKDININYLNLIETAFKLKLYVGIATHDVELLKPIYKMIKEMKISKHAFEFQVLYGVPMSGWNERHLKNGYKVRVYVPFGEDWYPYSIRRLKENPSIAKYIIRDIIKK
jgi:proline dehydrogenase